MIRQFRKRHLYTWLVLALALPLGFIAAYQVIPEASKTDQKVQYANQTVIGPVVAEASSEGKVLGAKLRSSKNGLQKQLEIEVKEPIASPSAFVYISSDKTEDVNSARVVGTVQSKGTHFITLDSTLSAQPIERILVYDKIKGQLVSTIDF